MRYEMEYEDEDEYEYEEAGRARGRGQRDAYGQFRHDPLQGQSRRRGKRKKKRGLGLLGFLGFLLLLAVLAGGYAAFRYIQKDSGFWTVAVFGVDSRNGNLEKDALADVQMLCVIDRKTGAIRLVSVFRDTYMEIHPDGTYHKINEAYFKGGHEQAIRALERNLDVSIDDYATFNWKAVADAITILGGIDLEISDSEFRYINGFITETVESTGLGSHHLEHAGMNHLDGVQAVAYARLRLMDTDYNRTARQRLVIQLALKKARESDLKTLTTLAQAVLPQLSTSIGMDDVLLMAKNVRKYQIQETGGFPFSRGEADIGKKDCVIPLTLESNVVQLHQFLYGKEGYEPSSTVRQISARIASDSGMGQVAENAPKASVAGERALEGSASGTQNPGGAAQGAPETNHAQAVQESPSPAQESLAQTEGSGEESPQESSVNEESESQEETGKNEETGSQDETGKSEETGSREETGNLPSAPGSVTAPGAAQTEEASGEGAGPAFGKPQTNPEGPGGSAGIHVYDKKPGMETKEVGPGIP